MVYVFFFFSSSSWEMSRTHIPFLKQTGGGEHFVFFVMDLCLKGTRDEGVCAKRRKTRRRMPRPFHFSIVILLYYIIIIIIIIYVPFTFSWFFYVHLLISSLRTRFIHFYLFILPFFLLLRSVPS